MPSSLDPGLATKVRSSRPWRMRCRGSSPSIVTTPPDAGGKLLDDALAKRKDDEKGQAGQSYWEHVTEVYDAWCGLKDVHAGLIARVAGRYGLTVERVLRSSLLCVALHDVGKLTRNFQAMMGPPTTPSIRRR